MIVLTCVRNEQRAVVPGDKFALALTDATGCHVLIEETITVAKTIDFVASYRFALEDGTCPGFHLCGIFGNRAELPVEIVNAVRIENLTPEQRANFERTVGVLLQKQDAPPKSGEHRMLDENEAAAYLGPVSVRTLQDWRYRGNGGPAYHKVGKHVAYSVADLDAFVERNRVLPRASQTPKGES